MARMFQLSIVAPDRSVVDEPASSAVIPGSEGYFGVLAGHVHMVAALKPGLLEFLDGNNQRQHIAIGGGFAEVTPERLIVLADTAERASEIDVAQAEADLENARKALRGENASMTSEEAVLEVERAMNRIRAARGH
ncbi:MAG TPA: ATP synthase F1 subunit epsilon [Fimbriimonadaceae bacterium]|nr:ATP synthase F1 subunit epsilon [Fimbriimonadaceae bacterium]